MKKNIEIGIGGNMKFEYIDNEKGYSKKRSDYNTKVFWCCKRIRRLLNVGIECKLIFAAYMATETIGIEPYIYRKVISKIEENLGTDIITTLDAYESVLKLPPM